jgi:hypothetical protein
LTWTSSRVNSIAALHLRHLLESLFFFSHSKSILLPGIYRENCHNGLHTCKSVQGSHCQSHQSQGQGDSGIQPYQQIWPSVFLFVVWFLNRVLVLVRQPSLASLPMNVAHRASRYAFPPLVCRKLTPRCWSMIGLKINVKSTR